MGQVPFNKTKQFKDLQSKWYNKLKKSGFEDLEQGEKLLRYDGDWFHKHIDTLKYENTTMFFERCMQFGNTMKAIKRDKKIWGYFCEGRTLMEIEKLVDLKKSRIAEIIKGLIKEM